MKTKILFLSILSLTLLLNFSCSKDDGNQAAYSFIDQDLQGEFDGEAWHYSTGKVEVSYFDSTELDFEITSVTSNDPCSDNFLSQDVILFSIPDSVGLYELSLDFTGNSQTVTLYDSGTEMNNIATSGALEITKIDKVNGIVEGRMDATADSKNFVNGNFSITFCN